MTGKGKDRHKHEGKLPGEEGGKTEEGAGQARPCGEEAQAQSGGESPVPNEPLEREGRGTQEGPAGLGEQGETEQESGVPGPAEARDEAAETRAEAAKPEAAGGEILEKAEEEAKEKAKEEAEEKARVAEEKLAEWRERYLRLAADFDNYRKRQMKERAEVLMTANESLVVELLPVLDNMERAISALPKEIEGDGNFESIRKGVELTLRLFQAVLVKYGVEKLTVVGKKFDPFKHEALAQEESAEVKEDTVLEEIEAGYVLNGKVVRPAKVKVAKPKP